jgi:hypothetical protein
MFCAIRYPRGSWYCCNPLSNYQFFDSPFPLLSFFSSSFFVLLCLYHFPSLVCYSYDIPHLSFVHSLSISVTIRLGMWQMKNPAMHDLSIRRQVGSHTYYRLKYERLKRFQIRKRSAFLPAVKSVTGSVFMVIAIITPCLLLWTVWYLQTGPDYISASAGYGRLKVRTNLTQAGFTCTPWFGKKSDYGPCSATNSKSIVNSRSESTLERYMFRNKPKSSLDERWGSIR